MKRDLIVKFCFLIACVLIISLISGCTGGNVPKSPPIAPEIPKESPVQLPASFIAEIYSEGTFEGQKTVYISNVSFTEGKLTSGELRYEFGSGEEVSVWECYVDVKTMSWIDTETDYECGYYEDTTPISFDVFRQRIDSGAIKKAGECKKQDVCYRLI
jgi:hypothetical protein